MTTTSYICSPIQWSTIRFFILSPPNPSTCKILSIPAIYHIQMHSVFKMCSLEMVGVSFKIFIINSILVCLRVRMTSYYYGTRSVLPRYSLGTLKQLDLSCISGVYGNDTTLVATLYNRFEQGTDSLFLTRSRYLLRSFLDGVFLSLVTRLCSNLSVESYQH